MQHSTAPRLNEEQHSKQAKRVSACPSCRTQAGNELPAVPWASCLFCSSTLSPSWRLSCSSSLDQQPSGGIQQGVQAPLLGAPQLPLQALEGQAMPPRNTTRSVHASFSLFCSIGGHAHSSAYALKHTAVKLHTVSQRCSTFSQRCSMLCSGRHKGLKLSKPRTSPCASVHCLQRSQAWLGMHMESVHITNVAM